MHALIVKTVIYLIFALVYKPLNDVISIILGRTLEMLSHALVENSFSDFFFFFPWLMRDLGIYLADFIQANLFMTLLGF